MKNNIVKTIANWNVKDVFNLIDYIESEMIYSHSLLKKEWIKDVLNNDCLEVHFCTGGMSENERIVDALLKNASFKNLCYYQWTVGGHYVFRISLKQFGYLKLTDYAKKVGNSRQHIHRIIDRFDVIKISDNKQYIRLK